MARAKGLRESVVVLRHALRNALIPLITVIALNFPRLLGGTVIIESIFAWPGMGTLAITAVRGRDYPVIMAINLITASLILLSNLIADVIYGCRGPTHQVLRNRPAQRTTLVAKTHRTQSA